MKMDGGSDLVGNGKTRMRHLEERATDHPLGYFRFEQPLVREVLDPSGRTVGQPDTTTIRRKAIQCL